MDHSYNLSEVLDEQATNSSHNNGDMDIIGGDYTAGHLVWYENVFNETPGLIFNNTDRKGN